MSGRAKLGLDARLAWRHRRYLLRQSAGSIALVSGIIALFAAFYAWRVSTAALPATSEQATIVRIGIAPTGEYGDFPLVVIRTSDGSIVQMASTPDALRGCRTGGPVNLLRRDGNRWSLAAIPCAADGQPASH